LFFSWWYKQQRKLCPTGNPATKQGAIELEVAHPLSNTFRQYSNFVAKDDFFRIKTQNSNVKR